VKKPEIDDILVKFNTIILLVVLLIFCAFIDVSYSSVLLDRVVAVVNKEVVTWSDLYKMMESEASEQVKALNDEERRKVFRDNEALFLEKLIDMRLQIQEAKKLGIEVTSEDIKETIETIKKKYSLNDAAFEESLKKEGMTLEEYKKRLSEQILVSQFVSQKIRNKIIVSEEEVRRYMEANNEIGESEAFRLRQIFFKKPKDENEKKAVMEKASLVIQRLKAGEDFSALAKEYSEDPSGKIGGDTGYVKKNYMAAELADMLSKMNTGDFSAPFWTERGLHIIKLDEKVSKQTADQLKATARRQLVEEQFLEKYRSYIKGLRETARIEIRL
jgi:peptidyl-prolyl cis-trans isomerase SurA